jgi:hypothetical protein
VRTRWYGIRKEEHRERMLAVDKEETEEKAKCVPSRIEHFSSSYVW